ncbi:MAG: hypothetical protein PHV49_02715 [Alistipes sp.]|nr:hypothetical protein [Alistipes sp.]
MKKFGFLCFCALCLAGCGKDPQIDKVYDTVLLNATQSSFYGTLIQGVPVTSGVRINLAYTQGLGQTAEVLLPETAGLYCDPTVVQLAAASGTDYGSGTLVLPVSGTPTASGSITLRPVLRVGGYELFLKIPVSVTPSIALDVAQSSVSGTFHIGEAVSQGVISLFYTSYASQSVNVSAAAVEGLTVTSYTTTLEAAPSGGFLKIPVTGTPTAYGTQTLSVTLQQGDNNYVAAIPIVVTGDITLLPAKSALLGIMLKGEPLDEVSLAVAYTTPSAVEATLQVAASNGVEGSAFTTSLPAATAGIIEIPLSGTPLSDGTMNLTAEVTINKVLYTMILPVMVYTDTPGVPFVPETITYQGLEYQTLFVDINGNGYVDPGDVWLDRNIGATSPDPGSYGASGANAAAMGQMLQYGKPYGATTFDPDYTIDYDGVGEWSICPEGYMVPTLTQFNAAIAKLTGGTVSGNGVSGSVGITLNLMESALGLPLSGWLTGGATVPQAYGEAAGYWTSSKGSNTAPWKVDINNSSASVTGGNWVDAAWQIPVRCVKK